MLNESIRNKLMNNWGEMSECLARKAEVKLFDSLSCWECYLLAINPQDEDECISILVTEEREVIILEASLHDLLSHWNRDGEFMELDPLFVPRHAETLLKILQKRNPL
jgi:hypothetical protein